MTFNEILSFLNDNSGALTVIFTGVVTLSTVVYAVLTAILVSETKKMREVQTEPKISIIPKAFDFAINIVRLEIENIGQGPAEDVSFNTSVIAGGEAAAKLLEEFTETNFFSTGLKYMGAGQIFHSNYTDFSSNSDEKVKSVLQFQIQYKSATGRKYIEKCVIDMSEMDGGYQLGKPNLYAIAKSIEKIEKNFDHITSGFKKIHTNTYTSQDRNEEIEKRQKRMEERKAK